MKVNGKDCSVLIRTKQGLFSVPYCEETLREAVLLLQEDAAIEGDGICRAISKRGGVTGCVVTPLTIGTVPMMLHLALGDCDKPVFVTETRNLYKHLLSLLPMEDAEYFELIQSRGGLRRRFDGCRVNGFELRILRGETVKLRLDIAGENGPVKCLDNETINPATGERFSGDFVSYMINGREYKNIYGLTLAVKKEWGTKSELWIKRVLEHEVDLPTIIDEIVITARLIKDKYENRHFGTFRITLKKLMLTVDETNINSACAVIGPLRYYVNGTVSAEVFTNGDEVLL